MDQGKDFLFYCMIVKIMLFKDLSYHVYALFDNKKLKLSTWSFPHKHQVIKVRELFVPQTNCNQMTLNYKRQFEKENAISLWKTQKCNQCG